ncbi:hypothetical protein R1sor_001502 [Riccia sorocarpa]|uniref:Uncharacterized protein n=1 Tax=Riccia sorocarpa TaxID=122646 RepID=A0ABD3GZ97_9MARC
MRFVKGRVLFGAELDHDQTPVTTQRRKPANHAGLQPAEDEGDQELIRKFPQKPANPAASQSPDDDAQEMISNFPQMPANPATSKSPDELELEEDMIRNSHRRQATAGANTRGVPTINVTSQTIPATSACIDNHDNTAHVGNTFVAEAQKHRDSHVHSTPLRNTRSTTSAHASRLATVADRVTPRTTRRTTAPANRHHASGSRHHEPTVVSISSDSDIEVLDFAQRIRLRHARCHSFPTSHYIQGRRNMVYLFLKFMLMFGSGTYVERPTEVQVLLASQQHQDEVHQGRCAKRNCEFLDFKGLAWAL